MTSEASVSGNQGYLFNVSEDNSTHIKQFRLAWWRKEEQKKEGEKKESQTEIGHHVVLLCYSWKAD